MDLPRINSPLTPKLCSNACRGPVNLQTGLCEKHTPHSSLLNTVKDYSLFQPSIVLPGQPSSPMTPGSPLTPTERIRQSLSIQSQHRRNRSMSTAKVNINKPLPNLAGISNLASESGIKTILLADFLSSLRKLAFIVSSQSSQYSQSLVPPPTSEDFLAALLKESAILIGCERALFWSVEEEDLLVLFPTSEDSLSLPITNSKTSSLAGLTASTGQTYNIKNCYTDKRFSKIYDNKYSYKTISMLSTPITDSTGVLQLINKSLNDEFTKEDEYMVEHLALHSGLLLSNCLLLEHLQKEQYRNISLIEMVKILHSEPTASSLIFTLSNAAKELVSAKESSLYMISRARNSIVSLSTNTVRSLPAKGITGKVLASGSLVNISDVSKCKEFDKDYDDEKGILTKSILMLPIFDKANKEVIGIFAARNKNLLRTFSSNTFNEEDELILSTLLKVAGSILTTSTLFAEAYSEVTSEAQAAFGTVGNLDDFYSKHHTRKVSTIAEED